MAGVLMVTGFDAFRSSNGTTENPESTSVYAKITIKLIGTSPVSNAKLYLHYSKTNFDGDDEVLDDISGDFGITSVGTAGRTKTLLLGTFDKTKDWYFWLDCTPGLTPFSYNKDVVPRTNVPLFIGKNNNGVAIGQYSTANAGYYKFESAWPAYLYGGIADLGSAWRELPLASSSITTPGTYGDILQIRSIENKCIIKGSVMIKPGSGSVTIANLPNDCKPACTTFRLNACQGARIARVAVHGNDGTNGTNGYLVLEWVYNIAGGQFTSNAIWVDCSIEYWIDGGEN